MAINSITVCKRCGEEYHPSENADHLKKCLISNKKTINDILDSWYFKLSYGSLIGVSGNQLAEWKVLSWDDLERVKKEITNQHKREVST